uniref:Reverse transcriptase N-terminal domain-containing protein n=1 Tax=Gracilaria vermiculophylla TaxID=2608709 RepID=A0A345U8X2_9FLOR|nr:hypothetical protein [Gracilaria vermiculophylla]AXI96908.1 hypothetical protein [Gracilaria vermiculophylla]
MNEHCVMSNSSPFLEPEEFTRYTYKIYVLLCNICLHGTEWFNIKVLSTTKKTFNLKKTQILIHYMFIKHGLSNLDQLYCRNLIENLYVICTSVRTHVYIHASKNKQSFKKQIHCFYWILKTNFRLLIYDIYWNLELNKNICKYTIYNSKNLLYIKDLLNRSRFNSYVKLNNLTKKIFNFLTTFFEFYNASISFKVLVQFYIVFSKIIYIWFKKKHKKHLKYKLYNYWNNQLFIAYIKRIKINILYTLLCEKINR